MTESQLFHTQDGSRKAPAEPTPGRPGSVLQSPSVRARRREPERVVLRSPLGRMVEGVGAPIHTSPRLCEPSHFATRVALWIGQGRSPRATEVRQTNPHEGRFRYSPGRGADERTGGSCCVAVPAMRWLDA